MAATAKAGGRQGIAILGMACVFPGAHSPEDLWNNVLAGRREFRRLPPERLPRSDYFDPDPSAPLRTYSDQIAVITGWSFDPVEFRIPPVTVEASDVTHWLALHTARAAIAESGLDLARADRGRIGVVLGNSLGGEFARSHNLKLRWAHVERSVRAALLRSGVEGDAADALVATVEHFYQSRLPDPTEDTLAGNMSNTIAGRVAGAFDLGGGAFTVDGACSSSLLAVATACNALASGDLDVALAGGVDVSLDPFELVGFAKTRALARDDIRPYHEHAAGMLPGEGCGVFVLAREEDARRMGRRPRAVLRGWGVSSDGAGGITAPGVEGQRRALAKAYERAGYGLGEVGLVEGHGTGTALGDRVELTALLGLLEEAGDGDPCWIGSVKGNIGHCKAAAGSAGLVKAVMALERRVIPPSANCERPNPVLGRPLGRLRPASEGRPWTGGGRPRRASVSAMGFGGANAHVTLEEAEPGEAILDEDLRLLGSAQGTELVLLAAPDEAALLEGVRGLAALADRIARSELVDLAATLAGRAADAVGAGAAAVRLAVVARSPWHLEASLLAVARHLEDGRPLAELRQDDVAAGAPDPRRRPRLVALYPGQGSQRTGMGRHLLRRHPGAARLMDEAGARVADLLDRPLRALVAPDPWAVDEAGREAMEAALRDTRVAQPALVAASLATLRVVERLGLVPDVHLGHSLGEVTALCAAGALDDDAAVRVASLRGRAMGELDVADPGAMLAVADEPDVVEPLLAGRGDVAVSSYNAPRQTVASGSSEGIAWLEARCRERGIRCRRLPVSHAFHSDIVAPAARRLGEALESVRFRPLAGAVVSSSTGRLLPPDADLRTLLSEHVRRPVRFVEAVRRAAAEGPALWVEVGPGGVLTSLVRDILGPDAPCLATDPGGEDGFEALNRVCAEAFVRGLALDPRALFEGRLVRPLDPDAWHPALIVNPCERPVGEPPAPAPLRLAAPEHSGVAEPASRPGRAEPAGAGAAAPESLEEFAVGWIAARTGYPREAITPDMRLRDDLNLDSIKVGELWVTLARRQGGDASLDPAAMANATLAEVTAALEASGAASDPGRVGYDSGALPDAAWVSTFGTRRVPAPLGGGRGAPAPPAGPVAFFGPGGPGSGPHDNSPAVERALRSRGFDLVTPRRPGAWDPAPAELAGVVVLLPEEDRSFLDLDAAAFDARVAAVTDDLYHVLRWAMGGGATGLRVVVVRPGDPGDAARDLDGGAGLLRTFFLENPGSLARWVRTPADWGADRIAEVIGAELGADGRSGAFAWSAAGERTTEVAVALDDPSPAEACLGPDDVAFVTGGGKGITAELALALARETGVRLVLAGSSPAPDPDADPEEDELANTFRRAREAGAAFTYVRCDVTDPASVRAAVAQGEAAMGPVTALLHGAGVTRFAALRDKEHAEFRRCVEVKVHGLRNLLEVLRPERLRALHVLSSVLGWTGMRSQADYTLANAWLDGAVRHVRSRHPGLHALSLGYSVWEGTGLGSRLGALEFLRSVGVTPIPVEEGVAAYLRLAGRRHDDSAFVVTGRLSPDLEDQLYGPAPAPGDRFLERVRRRVPGVELVADATLSFGRDPYLSHHVFQGTPILPGVMTVEAMVQAACVLLGTEERPELRDVRFERPLIVQEDAEVGMRVLAVRGDDVDGGRRVAVTIRSDADGFRSDVASATCLFGAADAEHAVAPPVGEALPLDPHDLAPVPLFQGPFFRNIEAIHRLEPGAASVTSVRVPDARYFEGRDGRRLRTGHPAARDAFLQSGALLLPPGTLPRGIEGLRIHRVPEPGEVVHCHVEAAEAAGMDGVEGRPGVVRHRAGYRVFDGRGRLVEEAWGLLLETPETGPSGGRPDAAPSLRAAPASLALALGGTPHALAVVAHDEAADERALVRLAVASGAARGAGTLRRAAAHANAVAAGRALRGLAPDGVDAAGVALEAEPDGRPLLCAVDGGAPAWLDGLDLSLADTRGQSVAFLARGRVGVDLEPVEARDAELWRDLLGADGIALARALLSGREADGSLDEAATRVWTLLEAAKKATGRPAAGSITPAESRHGWRTFHGPGPLRLLSTRTLLDDGTPAVLSVATAAGSGA